MRIHVVTHWNIDEHFFNLQAGQRLSQRLHKKLWVIYTDTFRNLKWVNMTHLNLLVICLIRNKKYLLNHHGITKLAYIFIYIYIFTFIYIYIFRLYIYLTKKMLLTICTLSLIQCFLHLTIKYISTIYWRYNLGDWKNTLSSTWYR